MEEDFLIVPSGPADSYCRLCLSEVDVESLLVVSNGLTQPNQTLVQLVKRYMEIDLTGAADNPCGICSTCRMMLEEFERFRDRCLRCDYALTGKGRNGMRDLPFQCSECSVKFQFKTDFEKHWKSFHDLPNSCDHCDARFVTESLLKYHQFQFHGGVVEDQTLSCSHCPRIFANEKQLQFHVKVLHGPVEAPKEIDPPVKKSKPDAPKKDDANKKPFMCETCGSQFHFIGSLRHHVKKVHKPAPKPRRNVTPVVRDETTSQPAIIVPASLTTPIVQEPMPETIVPIFQDQNSSANMTILPSYDQDSLPIEEGILPEQMPLKVEQPEPVTYPATEEFQFPGMYPFVIALERLDPNLVPPILNYEIPLGKIYYAQQQLAEPDTSDQLDDELLMNYPTYTQRVCKQYVCNVCFQEFPNNASLSRHRQFVHEGIVFQCDDCGKQFQSRPRLERHSYQHTNNFPHPCDECPLKFSRQNALLEHKEKYHVPGAPPLTIDYCPYCSRAFCKMSTLKNHISVMHRDQDRELMVQGDDQDQPLIIHGDQDMASLMIQSDQELMVHNDQGMELMMHGDPDQALMEHSNPDMKLIM
ncbi:zinc finger protein 366 [Aedes aegypti]|uniref:Uncharacterized protein n=1 Tax=Aedes aegypti TaxID=7159 RepID=A0A6I8TIK0_AEDAE|nr:zinc finger protein 366 [Aedes aegypti]